MNSRNKSRKATVAEDLFLRRGNGTSKRNSPGSGDFSAEGEAEEKILCHWAGQQRKRSSAT
jgi:hypothetical protein